MFFVSHSEITYKMKRIFLSLAAVLMVIIVINGQQISVLEQLENRQQVNRQPNMGVTRGAVRLFSDKDDLASVIMLIPKGSVVEILGTDGEYLRVMYQEHTGYLPVDKVEMKVVPDSLQLKKSGDVLPPPVSVTTRTGEQQAVVNRDNRGAARVSAENRLTYLEYKYGKDLAARMYAGKIWKGMTGEMVRDAWGEPDQVNRIVRNNTAMEEWVYRGTWLLLEQGRLREWGALPVKR